MRAKGLPGSNVMRLAKKNANRPRRRLPMIFVPDYKQPYMQWEQEHLGRYGGIRRYKF